LWMKYTPFYTLLYWDQVRCICMGGWFGVLNV